jgi:hypothetical protein
MQRALSIAIAVAAMLTGAMPWSAARAMPLAAPATLSAAPLDAVVTPVAMICGLNGCAPVRVTRIRRPPPGFVTRAAPLVFPAPNAPQPAVAANNK